MGQQRRQHSPEFKADAVALVRSSGRSIAAIVRVRDWSIEPRLLAEAGRGRSQDARPGTLCDRVRRICREPGASPSGDRTGGGARDPETSYGLLGEGVARVRVFAFVAAQKADFPVRTLCRVCRVSTSGFYAYAARKASPPSPGELGESRGRPSRRPGAQEFPTSLWIATCDRPARPRGHLGQPQSRRGRDGPSGPSRSFESAQDAHDPP